MKQEHQWEGLISQESPRVENWRCAECGLTIEGKPEEVQAKMEQHTGGFPCYPGNSELERLRAENTRLRGEVQAMQEAVDKFWSEFSARTILLLASLNKTDEGEERED